MFSTFTAIAGVGTSQLGEFYGSAALSLMAYSSTVGIVGDATLFTLPHR
jgi:hypothetical protein